MSIPATEESGSAAMDKHYAPGEFIFKEGDSGELAYTIISGEVEVCKLSGGTYVRLQQLKAGAMFGEMAIIEKGARAASARATTNAVIREIDEKALMAHIRKSPKSAMNMMHRLAGYVRNSNESLAGTTFEQLEKSGKKPGNIEVTESDGRAGKWDTDVDFILNEYQSPSELIVKRPFPPVLFAVFFVIMGLVVAFIAWSSLSIVDTTVSARGRLTTRVPTISVQATDSSVVKMIHIEVGDQVKKGSLLVTLDDTVAEADFARADTEIALLKTKIQRLTAEMEQKGVEFASQISNEIERKVYLNRYKEYSARINSFDLDMLSIRKKLETTNKDIRLARQQLKIKKELEAASLKLYRQKVGSYVKLLSAKDKHLSAAREFQNLRNSIGESKSSLESIRSKKMAFVSKWFSDIGSQLSEVIKQRDVKLEELVKLEQRIGNIEILAPADGTIMEVKDLFVGAIVNKGATVMSLVPSNVALDAEIDINPKDISNIVVGAEVSLKLDALPYQKHGDIAGEITFISESTVDQSLDGTPGTFYRATATVLSVDLRDLSDDFQLVPGMLLKADVISGQRRLITYFIYPVVRTIETSFSEP
ncbi:MAG: HlyD family type I secretion periplasmic adaptor subunit [Magnetococcales bacterium]|nr:HlyD family type I secretion periplasmic adaptor subunit [Magnetococcales bacterium]